MKCELFKFALLLEKRFELDELIVDDLDGVVVKKKRARRLGAGQSTLGCRRSRAVNASSATFVDFFLEKSK